jgi:ketosteroid isomerase-like protein
MASQARQVVERLLEVGLRQDMDAVVDLMAPDGTLEWPFRPAGIPDRLNGREEIRAFMTRAAALPVKFDEYRDIVIHETTDPEVIIVEYEVYGHLTSTGGPFRQTIIAVLRVRDGLIVSYRDFLNPLAVSAAAATLEP